MSDDFESEGEQEGWESNSETSNDKEGDGGEDNVFQPEVNVYERVGFPTSLISSLIGTTMPGELGELQKKLDRMFQDPFERFAIYTDAISRQMDARDVANISDDDIVRMILFAKNVKKIGYKNPTAYILGYLATDGGRSIEKKKVKHVFENVLPNVTDSSVTEPDVIRYSRLWLDR